MFDIVDPFAYKEKLMMPKVKDIVFVFILDGLRFFSLCAMLPTMSFSFLTTLATGGTRCLKTSFSTGCIVPSINPSEYIVWHYLFACFVYNTLFRFLTLPNSDHSTDIAILQLWPAMTTWVSWKTEIFAKNLSNWRWTGTGNYYYFLWIRPVAMTCLVFCNYHRYERFCEATVL